MARARGSSEQPVAQRQGDSFRAAGDAQLGQDVADVRFDGGGPDGQPCGDLGVVQPLDHQGQHDPLAPGQVEDGRRGLGGGMDQRLGGLGRECGHQSLFDSRGNKRRNWNWGACLPG